MSGRARRPGKLGPQRQPAAESRGLRPESRDPIQHRSANRTGTTTANPSHTCAASQRIVPPPASPARTPDRANFSPLESTSRTGPTCHRPRRRPPPSARPTTQDHALHQASSIPRNVGVIVARHFCRSRCGHRVIFRVNRAGASPDVSSTSSLTRVLNSLVLAMQVGDDGIALPIGQVLVAAQHIQVRARRQIVDAGPGKRTAQNNARLQRYTGSRSRQIRRSDCDFRRAFRPSAASPSRMNMPSGVFPCTLHATHAISG